MYVCMYVCFTKCFYISILGDVLRTVHVTYVSHLSASCLDSVFMLILAYLLYGIFYRPMSLHVQFPLALANGTPLMEHLTYIQMYMTHPTLYSTIACADPRFSALELSPPPLLDAMESSTP